MALPFPPLGTPFTPETIKMYAMLRPQYDYDKKGSFACCRTDGKCVARQQTWGGWWFADTGRSPSPETYEDSDSEWEPVEDNCNVDDEFISDDEDYAEYKRRVLHHVPRRRMAWMARLASRIVPSNVA